ncbi:MAG TPA: glycosyltransferase, partial [Isosphaeraceae bacterium]|nr:glycosyltransferase [Isosphaeraceae bacterium]
RKRDDPRPSMDRAFEGKALAAGFDPEAEGRDLAPGECFDLVLADASWPWAEKRFAPLAELGVRLLMLKACDWRNALEQRRPARDWLWPTERLGPRLWQQTFVLPPGWMKTYPRLGMRPLARAIRNWRRSLDGPRPLALAISYPHYLYLRDLVRPDVLIYYNMDDYGFYWWARRKVVQELERRAVREADLSLFCARVRADELQQEVPDAADRIIHLPHGAPAGAIAESPQCRPGPVPEDIAGLGRPLLGFVGTLEDRIDWPLIEHLARAFPEGSVVLIGRDPAPAPRQKWYRSFQSAVERPNVHVLGWKPPHEIARYNAAFDVCLIPYLTDHPFNRVACPTKVMDYMAASRPVVSTALPECRLYAHLFDIAETPAAFTAAVREVVDRGSDDGRAPLRWETARATTWENTSAALLRHLQCSLSSSSC